jgi:hypothetical protein
MKLVSDELKAKIKLFKSASHKVHLHRQCGPTILLSDAISIENFLSPRN